MKDGTALNHEASQHGEKLAASQVVVKNSVSLRQQLKIACTKVNLKVHLKKCISGGVTLCNRSEQA